MRAAIAAFLAGLCLCLPAKAQEERETAHYAIITGDTPLLDEALAGRTVFSKATQRDLLTLAARQGAADMVRHLVEAGFDPDLTDAEGYSVIMRTLEAGQVEMAVLLRDLGASLEGVTEDGYTVRLLAENAGLEDFGPVYPARLPNVSQDDLDQMLLLAAEAGNLANLRFALDYGADPAARAGNGWNALMLAALGGHERVVRALIDAAGPEDDMYIRVGNDIDPVVAALVGEGGGDHAAAARVLDPIRTAWPEKVRQAAARHHEAAHNIGYSDRFIETNLGRPPLTVMDAFPPVEVPPGRDGWRAIQTWAAKTGGHDLVADGQPGPQTLDALLDIFLGVEEQIHDGCVAAARRALDGKGGVATELRNAFVAGGGQLDHPPHFKIIIPIEVDWILGTEEYCRFGPFDLSYPTVENRTQAFTIGLSVGTLRVIKSRDAAEIVLEARTPPVRIARDDPSPQTLLRLPSGLRSAMLDAYLDQLAGSND